MSAPGKDPAGNILQQLNIREPSQQTRRTPTGDPAACLHSEG
jgi:hypothetical protein